MIKDKEFIIYCHFSAIAKKNIKATNLEEAKHLAESDESVHFDEIMKLTEPCIVDEVVELKSDDESRPNQKYEYKSWGSE